MQSGLKFCSGSVPLNFMNIEPLTGSNFKRWKADIEIYLSVNHLDLPMYKTPPEALTIASTSEQQKYFDEWHRLNRVCKNVMKRTMSDSVSGSIEEKELATEFLESIGERFKESDKAQIANLLNKLLNTKYTGSGTIREHILKLVDYAAKLKTLKNPISDEMLIHHTLNSLPASFEHLNTTYLAQKDKWDINELISICVQVDERIKKEKNEKSVNLVGKPKWKNQKGNNQKGKKFSPKTALAPAPDSKIQKPYQTKCYFCRKSGHLKRDCTGFKAWLTKKGIHKEEKSQK